MLKGLIKQAKRPYKLDSLLIGSLSGVDLICFFVFVGFGGPGGGFGAPWGCFFSLSSSGGLPPLLLLLKPPPGAPKPPPGPPRLKKQNKKQNKKTKNQCLGRTL